MGTTMRVAMRATVRVTMRVTMRATTALMKFLTFHAEAHRRPRLCRCDGNIAGLGTSTIVIASQTSVRLIRVLRGMS